ncbi:hypothetical protein L596_020487 [Steinernema carpocapsae]|uniref:Uncharacterized protein n=1 Tax=Steinernema carpocapsae TaxID=34508 RepID=A0A4U5MUG2_STECR|nr:hypothetical protein L596_020487 [Steinernema carpocapsae]
MGINKARFNPLKTHLVTRMLIRTYECRSRGANSGGAEELEQIPALEQSKVGLRGRERHDRSRAVECKD